MCYSVAGRIQSRLAGLLAPALLAAVLVAWSGDQRYLTMFIVMAAVSLDLDLFLYPHVIEYQARWQTYALGVAEFFLTLAVVRWWLSGTLPLYELVLYYVAAWVGGYVIVSAVLPTLDAAWSENGGEIWRAGSIEGLPSRLFGRARDHVLSASGTTLTVAALLFLLGLEETVLPGTLTLLQVAAALFGSLATSEVARRLGSESAPELEESLALGLVVALLVRGPHLWAFLLCGALAAGSRSWLRVGRRPLFNGAAAAFVFVILLIPGMYASDAQWGNSLLLPLVLANLALLVSLRSHRLWLLLALAFTLVAQWLVQGYGHGESLTITLPEYLPTAVVFFAGFVATDPASTPDDRWTQIAVGAAIGLLGIALQRMGIGLAYAVALLGVNEATALVLAAVPPARRFARRPSVPPAGHGMTRRTFLGAAAAAGGAVALGGALNRLAALDPAVLALPAEPALAHGQAIPRFENVTRRAGIVPVHHGVPGEGSPAIGTGVTWGDYDGDGGLDLYVTDHAGNCHLYRNNGDGTFSDVAAAAGVDRPGRRPTSAVFVDYDNDGRPDLYVGVAYGPNVLYHNNGDGTFTDVTKRAGLGDLGRTMSTAWADYDGDGYLDVFVANYTDVPITFDPNSSPSENARKVIHIPRPLNRLYHNNGDGTFTDVTDLLGIEYARGLGFSAVWFDYNNDGRPDLYVAYDFGNEVTPNVLWRNDGPDGNGGWRFTPVSDRMGVATAANPMGVASGDYNNDGWLDVAVSNIGPNLLYRNAAGASFHDVAPAAGVVHKDVNVGNMLNPSMTWGTSFADFNNDGWLDLYMVAGAMDYENVPQPNMVYINDHTGGFVDVSAASGANDPGQGRSVAVADYDGDGYLDMFVANYGQPPLLYRNVSRAVRNHWLRLSLEGTHSNRDAVGARVTVYAGGHRQMQEVQIGQGLGSSNDKALHFGLGSAGRADRIEIRWPSGRSQVIKRVRVDRTLMVREPGPSRW